MYKMSNYLINLSTHVRDGHSNFLAISTGPKGGLTQSSSKSSYGNAFIAMETSLDGTKNALIALHIKFSSLLYHLGSHVHVQTNVGQVCSFQHTSYITSWSLLGPGVEVGLTPSFIDYVRLSLSTRVVLLLQH